MHPRGPYTPKWCVCFWQLEADIIQQTRPTHPDPAHISSIQVRVGMAVCTPEGSPMHRWNHDEKLNPLGQ